MKAWLAAIAVLTTTSTAPVGVNPPELGKVRWRRGYDAALAEAKTSGKPLLVLFDEVPGCSTVNAYGKQVLSHPLIADAAEEAFVPVAVYNNVRGDDGRVLAKYGEPTWNNPVVRIVDGAERPLAPRLAGDYSVRGLAEAMATALENAHRPAPAYLSLLLEEERARSAGVQTATFGMSCFWTGEVTLGALPGVVATSPGFAGGREVVKVTYDPSRLSTEQLAERARAAGYSFQDESFRPSPGDDKYQLAGTALAHVPMTALQKARINANRTLAEKLLSPRQRQALALVQREKNRDWPNLVSVDDAARGLEMFERAAQGDR